MHSKGRDVIGKMGRPKADNPKDIDVKVRLDKSLNEKLMQYCVQANITRAEAIRKGIELLLNQKK